MSLVWGTEPVEPGPGKGLDQASRIGVRRPAKNLVDRPGLHDAALIEDGEAVAEGGHGREVVGDVQDGQASLLVKAREQRENFSLGDDIQSAGWLVGNHQGRPMQERHRDQNALGLAYAELARISAQKGFLAWQAYAGQ